jgi:hypothetical protein
VWPERNGTTATGFNATDTLFDLAATDALRLDSA